MSWPSNNQAIISIECDNNDDEKVLSENDDKANKQSSIIPQNNSFSITLPNSTGCGSGTNLININPDLTTACQTNNIVSNDFKIEVDNPVLNQSNNSQIDSPQHNQNFSCIDPLNSSIIQNENQNELEDKSEEGIHLEEENILEPHLINNNINENSIANCKLNLNIIII